MSRTARLLLAAALLLVGVALAEFSVDQAVVCLGPIGVTAVQCAKASGSVPHPGLGLPILVVTIAVATFVLLPVASADRRLAVLGGIVGGAIGSIVFLALRPRTLEGFDSRGVWISFAIPLDANEMVAATILAALLGTVVVRAGLDIQRACKGGRRQRSRPRRRLAEPRAGSTPKLSG